MKLKSRPARCAMLSTLPVRKLSIPTTLQPRSRSVSDRCDPMKPAAPVMTALGIERSAFGVALKSVAAVQPADERQPHDLQIERDGPVLDVIEVVLDPLLERGIAAPAVDLRPAGDAGLDLVAQHVLRNAVLELLDEIGALGPRADDRHIAAEDVPELRQFVEVKPAEPLADRRAARVVVARPDRAGLVLGPLVHRAEFVDVERLAVEAHPLLLVEDRPLRRVADERHDRQEGEREPEKRRPRDGEVDAPLQEAVEAPQRYVVQADDWNAVEILEPRAQRDELQQVGDDVDLDALAVGGFDNAQHLDVLVEWKGDVDVVDLLLADDLVGLRQRSEQRQSAVPDVIARGAVVEEANDLEAEFPVLEHLVRDHASKIAGPRDQHALETDTGLPAALEDLADDL